jgi:hypothetical protein
MYNGARGPVNSTVMHNKNITTRLFAISALAPVIIIVLLSFRHGPALLAISPAIWLVAFIVTLPSVHLCHKTISSYSVSKTSAFALSLVFGAVLGAFVYMAFFYNLSFSLYQVFEYSSLGMLIAVVACFLYYYGPFRIHA